jgi:uncharacterized protein (UPF0305 family)
MSDNLTPTNQIKDVVSCDELGLAGFLEVLKNEANFISIHDIMHASTFMIKDAQFVQSGYREEYIKAYTMGFITRIKEVKEYQLDHDGKLDLEEVKDAILLLLTQEEEQTGEDNFNPTFFRIYKIISLYTTFILDEPIHPVGTPFPGGYEVKLDGRKYLCPVKEGQKDNPGAVCGFCIAEQDPETL